MDIVDKEYVREEKILSLLKKQEEHILSSTKYVGLVETAKDLSKIYALREDIERARARKERIAATWCQGCGAMLKAEDGFCSKCGLKKGAHPKGLSVEEKKRCDELDRRCDKREITLNEWQGEMVNMLFGRHYA